MPPLALCKLQTHAFGAGGVLCEATQKSTHIKYCSREIDIWNREDPFPPNSPPLFQGKLRNWDHLPVETKLALFNHCSRLSCSFHFWVIFPYYTLSTSTQSCTQRNDFKCCSIHQIWKWFYTFLHHLQNMLHMLCLSRCLLCCFSPHLSHAFTLPANLCSWVGPGEWAPGGRRLLPLVISKCNDITHHSGAHHIFTRHLWLQLLHVMCVSVEPWLKWAVR